MSKERIDTTFVTKLIIKNIRQEKSLQEKNKVIEFLCNQLRERSEVNAWISSKICRSSIRR